MHRIQRVLLDLEPVAGDDRNANIADRILSYQRLPARKQWHGLWPQIRPDESTQLLSRIGRHLDALAESVGRIGGLLVRLLNARARLVVLPAVVSAADTLFLREAVEHVHAAMLALLLDQSNRPRSVAIEHQVLAQNADTLGGVLVQLTARGDWMPVATHKVAAGRTGGHLCKYLVLFLGDHGTLLLA